MDVAQQPDGCALAGRSHARALGHGICRHKAWLKVLSDVSQNSIIIYTIYNNIYTYNRSMSHFVSINYPVPPYTFSNI